MFDPNTRLIEGERHQELVTLADYLSTLEEGKPGHHSFMMILDSGNTASAVAFLNTHRVSLSKALLHLGLTTGDLKIVGTPGRSSGQHYVSLIRAVRNLTGWRLAPAVWILKLLAAADDFYRYPDLADHTKRLAVLESATQAFQAQALALGFHVEVVVESPQDAN